MSGNYDLNWGRNSRLDFIAGREQRKKVQIQESRKFMCSLGGVEGGRCERKEFVLFGVPVPMMSAADAAIGRRAGVRVERPARTRS
jgi:hypothetical protein